MRRCCSPLHVLLSSLPCTPSPTTFSPHSPLSSSRASLRYTPSPLPARERTHHTYQCALIALSPALRTPHRATCLRDIHPCRPRALEVTQSCRRGSIPHQGNTAIVTAVNTAARKPEEKIVHAPQLLLLQLVQLVLLQLVLLQLLLLLKLLLLLELLQKSELLRLRLQHAHPEHATAPLYQLGARA